MDFTGWEKTNEDAYVYRGFLSEELCDAAFEQSRIAQEEGDINENPNNKGILLLGVPMLQAVVDKVRELFDEDQYEVKTAKLIIHYPAKKGNQQKGNDLKI